MSGYIKQVGWLKNGDSIYWFEHRYRYAGTVVKEGVVLIDAVGYGKVYLHPDESVFVEKEIKYGNT